MFMYVVALMTVSAVITDFYVVRHINAMTFTFCFAHAAANAIERFNNNTSEKGENSNVILTLGTI